MPLSGRPVRVDFPTYAKVDRSLGLRTTILFVLSSVVGFFSISWIFILVLAAQTEEQPVNVRVGLYTMACLTVIPTLAAVVMLIKGATGRTRRRRLNALAKLVRRDPSAAVNDIAQKLAISFDEADALFFDAQTLGVLVDTHPTQPPVSELDRAAPSNPPLSTSSHDSQADIAVARTLLAQPMSDEATALDRTISGAVLNETYQIEESIGSGAMGVVYVARQMRTGRRYAIKVLLPDARPSADALKRFKREATILSSLGHSGIVAVHDFDVTREGLYYMVMELLQGETLDGRLAYRGSLRWDEARSVALEIGAALITAHGAGILHRDLKPSNVFLAHAPGEPEHAVLLDFGLAKPPDRGAASRITRPNEVLGTPLYMAPEQARGEPLGQSSDVYGLGAVLYEMVTGAPPFIDKTLASLYARVINEPPPRASDAAVAPLPPGLDEILERALAKEPGGRFESVAAFISALRSLEEPPAF